MEIASPKPAAIYARISRDRDQDEEGVSNQVKECRALAERLGWEVVGVYIDNDISAYSGKPRPQYRAMLAAIRAGDVRAVLAWHTDRLHRRLTDLEEFVDIVEAHRVQVQTANGGIDLSSPDGRMNARILASVAQREIEHNRERVRLAKRVAAEQGKYRGGPRPYGFEKDGLTIRESEAAIIREMTTAVLAGRSLASLTHELNERAAQGEAAAWPATSNRPKTSERRQGPWRYGALRDMLLRPRNAGLLARGLPGKSGQKYDFEEIGPASWPAIVEQEEWRALVRLLTDPSRRTNAQQGSVPRWLGSGIYRCGAGVIQRDVAGRMILAEDGKPIPVLGEDGEQLVCGAVLRATPHGGTEMRRHARRYLYRCSDFAHLTVGQRQTDEFVRAVVAERVRDPKVIAAMQPANTHLAGDRERRNVLAARLADFENDYIEGRITAALLQKSMAKVQSEIDEIDARLAAALQQSTSSSVLRAPDPGQAFLDAPLDVQRAVVATVVNVEVLPAAVQGAKWTSDRIRITPVAS